MCVCISLKEDWLGSVTERGFGRAACFVVIDMDTLECVAIENAASTSGGGAGVVSDQIIVEEAAEAVIKGNAV